MSLPLKPAGGFPPAADNGDPALAGILDRPALFRVLRDQPASCNRGSPASRAKRFPYRLFAVSNAASLLALLAYPVTIEPFLATRSRCFTGPWLRRIGGSGGLWRPAICSKHVPPIARCRLSTIMPWLWIALAACASALWLAIANYLGQRVAAMPFLWVIPMTVYLLSFILCFESDGWYRPLLFRWLMPLAWIAICARMAIEGALGGLDGDPDIFRGTLHFCAFSATANWR